MCSSSTGPSPLGCCVARKVRDRQSAPLKMIYAMFCCDFMGLAGFSLPWIHPAASLRAHAWSWHNGVVRQPRAGIAEPDKNVFDAMLRTEIRFSPHLASVSCR